MAIQYSPISRLAAEAARARAVRSLNFQGHDFMIGRAVTQVTLKKPPTGIALVSLPGGLTAEFISGTDLRGFQDGQLINVVIDQIKIAGRSVSITCRLPSP